MNTRVLSMFFLGVSLSVYSQGVSIEKFNSNRDMFIVEKILNDNYSALAYEAIGYPEGTTKKYLNSSDYTTKVLLVDGQTVGFINYVEINPPFFLKWFMTKKGVIHLMGVDTNCKHKGYGRALLKYALEYFKDMDLKSVHLMVKTENLAARKLYEKEGFTCPVPKEAEKHFRDLPYSKDL